MCISCLELVAEQLSQMWSGQTTHRPLLTSTVKVVYASIVCHNLPAISFYEVRSDSGHFMPSTFLVSSINQPRMVQVIWEHFRVTKVDLFTSRETIHCQLFCSLTGADPWHGCTGTHLASEPMQLCVYPIDPACTDTVQGQGGREVGLDICTVFAHLDLVLRTDASLLQPLPSGFPRGRAFLREGAPYDTHVQTSGTPGMQRT